MTVTYTAEVATCRGFGCFIALLGRWKGSIYKLVWPDLFAFLSLYYGLRLVYWFLLDESGKRTFSEVSKYFDSYSNYIPLSFVLGFYISIIMQRWWDQYLSIPWPDPIAVFVSAHIHGQDDRGRLMRRTIMRYVCLCLSMVFSMICPRVKKRFPTLEHFVDAGLMTENEKSIVSDLNEQFPHHSKHWLPIVWAASIVTRARKEGRIRDDFAVKTIIDELNKFRGQCGTLLNYDSISVPLVYTQVVTLATYSFVITSAIGRQWHLGNKNCIDQYFPVFATLQFFFYMGWLKVAESLINPFGEDDDDFEINWIVDRNVTVSYLIVDEMHHEHPELIKDQYWNDVFPTELPHTVASQPFKEKIPQPSTANIAVSNTDAEYVLPTSVKTEETCDDDASGIHFSVKRTGSVTRPRTSSAGSNHSLAPSNMGSIAASLHRISSVTNVLKRLISKDASSTDGPNRLSESASSASLAPKPVPAGSLRIADQVIEEVDEQVTITSMAGRGADTRPTAASLFEPIAKQTTAPDESKTGPSAASRDPTDDLFGSHPHPASAPIAVPQRRTNALSGMSLPTTLPVSPTRSFSLRSAPPLHDTTSSGLGSGSICPVGDSISIGSGSTDDEGDDFQRLKAARRREMERIALARSISAIADANRESPTEDMALIDVSTDSQTQLIRSDSAKKK